MRLKPETGFVGCALCNWKVLRSSGRLSRALRPMPAAAAKEPVSLKS